MTGALGSNGAHAVLSLEPELLTSPRGDVIVSGSKPHFSAENLLKDESVFRLSWGYSFPEPAALVFPNLGRVSKAAGGVFFSSRHAPTSEETHLSCGVMLLGGTMGGGGRGHLLFGHCR